MERKVDAIILAAGSIGRENLFPRALIEINGKSLLQRQIEWLRPYVKKIIVACTESEAKQIRKYHPGIDVIFATTPDLPGSAGSLKKAVEAVSTDDFIVVNVDDLTDIDLASLINFGTNTVCVANPVLHYGMVEIENQEITSFREKPILKDLWVNCGVYFLNKIIIEKLPRKGNLARDVLPYIKLRAYKHFGKWEPIWKQMATVK